MGSSKQQGKHPCLLLCPDADEGFEAAAERGVKLMPRDYAKDQQCSMPVDAVLSFPERHISGTHLYFTLSRSVVWSWDGV